MKKLEKFVDLYIWGRFSVHLRPILCTFEADSDSGLRIALPRPASLADFTADRTLLPRWGSVIGREISETGRARECDSGLRPQMYRECTFWGRSVHLRPIFCLSIYLSISFAKIGLKCTYIWGQSDSTGQGSLILGPVLLISRPIALQWPEDRTPSPSRVRSTSKCMGNRVRSSDHCRTSPGQSHWFHGQSHSLTRSVHLRLILYTFEANSLYIWGRIWNRPQMYRSCSLIGSEASHEKIN